MNPFDTIILVILGYCLIRGFFRGLVKEISSIVGVLSGFYAGYTYYPGLADSFSTWISNMAYANILAFMLIFCSVFIAISIMGAIIKYLMNIAFLGWIDRLSGLMFGAFKGILIVSILLVMLTAFLPKNSALISESHMAPHVSWASEKLAKMISSEMKQEFFNKIKELKKAWNIPL
ncbi:MAG: CvpA family protein [Desulfatirhabdiaceae bacterium]